MKYSIIISYTKLDETQELSLKRLLNYLTWLINNETEIIIVEQGKEKTINWLNDIKKHDQINYIITNNNKKFNKGVCYNIGVKNSKGDCLIFNDINMYLRLDSYKYSLRLLNTHDIINSYNSICYLDEYNTDLFIKYNYNFVVLRNIKSTPSSDLLKEIFIIKKDKFLSLNGFDEESNDLKLINDIGHLDILNINDIVVCTKTKIEPKIEVVEQYDKEIINRKPLSIIIPAYEVQDYIEECLDSIENQDYFKNNDNYEILVGVDGCEKTLNKLKEICDKYRNLRIFMMKSNKGTYVTTNTLIDLVSYENILLFGSDDIMKPFMIDEIMKYENDYDIIQFCFHDFEGSIHTKLSMYYSVAIGAIFYKKKIMDLAGGYQNWICSADLELLTRLGDRVKTKQIKNHLFYRRIHNDSLTIKSDTNLSSDFRKKYLEQIHPYGKDENIKIKKVVNKYTELKNNSSFKLKIPKIKKEIVYDYDICVIITTYNREKYLQRLLYDIEINKSNYKILITVFDDATNESIDLSNHNDIKYIRYKENHGKKKYWELITDTMTYCKKISSKYFIYLPDDVTISNNFFKKSIEMYEDIQDEQKICLNLLLPEELIGKSNWTNFEPIEYERYYKTQWCDLCFISEKKMLKSLDYKVDEITIDRWTNNKEYLGSGVGKNISIRLSDMGYNLYHVKNTLVYHDDHESIMNKETRRSEKLTTKRWIKRK